MSKLIVTHKSPDFDAIFSVWLIKKYLPEFKHSCVEFVSPGTTYNNKPADIDNNILHVDTGNGKYDHHQLSTKTCASYLIYIHKIKPYIKSQLHQNAIERFIDIILEIDHFHESEFVDAYADYHLLYAPSILKGYKYTESDNIKRLEYGFSIIESVLIMMIHKIQAEKEILLGYEYNSLWGKTIAIESNISLVTEIALKQGYNLVIQMCPNRKYTSIKLHPKNKKSLKKLYKYISKKEKKTKWFFHANGKILINGSQAYPKTTSLKLSDFISLTRK